ncbi:hypothetical protein [Anaerotignum sp.]|nr:hypothetical protein [Anaerotignum sp.]MBQ7759309.1 hypothetical protein [Anaerotignum sp.]
MAKLRLKTSTATEVRRALSRVNNMLLNGQIEPKTANAIIYSCNSILTSLRVDEQERKIDGLERMLNELQLQKG